MTSRNCPALLIAAPASGQGKTTVTAALARLHARQGKRVRVFKCGPDFLDPMVLARASGRPVYQLDLWMVGEEESRRLLWEAAGEADLILIEGVMGLFDGAPSAADLARRFGVPVLAVIDGSAMAQTFGAMAHGLSSFQPDLPFAGVLANRVGSARHGEILRDSLPESIRWYGALPRSVDMELPSRHLGLVQAEELADLDARLDAAADALAQSAETELPPAVSFAAPTRVSLEPLLAGVRIGVARDAAFAFLYQANLDLLQALGAELLFSRRCAFARLPAVDSLYLPGATPSCTCVHCRATDRWPRRSARIMQLANPSWPNAGMLYLLDGLTDRGDERAEMLGLLPGEARMQQRLSALALQEVELPEGRLRGHTFHHSTLESPLQPLARGECPNYKRTAEAVYRSGRLTASYIHFYLPSGSAGTRRCSGHERTRLQRRGARRGLPRHCRAP